MRTLFVIRHGNTFDPGDTIRRVGRGTDLPLSASGRAQADALGRALGGRVERCVCSPLRRTRETAAALRVPVRLDDRLLEIDYGPDEGLPEADVVARLGADAIAAWDRDAVVPQGWLVDPDTLRADWAALLDGAGDGTAFVTSNGVARFLLDVCAHSGAERKLRTGRFGVIRGEPGSWTITAWNQRPALDGPA